MIRSGLFPARLRLRRSHRRRRGVLGAFEQITTVIIPGMHEQIGAFDPDGKLAGRSLAGPFGAVISVRCSRE